MIGPDEWAGYVARHCSWSVDPLAQQDQTQRDPPRQTAKRRWSFRLFSALIGLVLGLVVTEIALQLLDRPQQMYSGWRSRASADQLNQLRYRGRKIEYQEDDFIIVLLGDSQAEGWHIPMGRTPEVKLVAYLRELGIKRVKVFTLGCEGYGYDQQLLALTEYYEDYGFRADLVLQWQTPYNDLWENMLVNQWMEASISKPTFVLDNGKLVDPKVKRVGQALLSRIKLVAAAQKLLDQELKLITSDREWEKKYLPAPYKPIIWAGPKSMQWQEAWDVNFGWMRHEQFENDKSNFTIGLTPPSPRTQYGIKLANALLRRIESLVKSRGGRFVTFDVKTRSSRLWLQPLHMEARVYEFRQQRYRFSFGQEYENIRKMNQGLIHEEIDCQVDDWRSSKEDWHLNEEAMSDVFKRLAARLVEMKIIPRLLHDDAGSQQ